MWAREGAVMNKFHFRTIRGRMTVSFVAVFLIIIAFMGCSIYIFTGRLLEKKNEQSYIKILDATDIVVAFSFIMPFLTDCGIMEFLGVIAKPVVRPLFHVPGRASVDLIASWFGASNAAVILTREQYMRGFYTKREAGYIMTNFSLVSIPFCLMVADTMGIANSYLHTGFQKDLLSNGNVPVQWECT